MSKRLSTPVAIAGLFVLLCAVACKEPPLRNGGGEPSLAAQSGEAGAAATGAAGVTGEADHAEAGAGGIGGGAGVAGRVVGEVGTGDASRRTERSTLSPNEHPVIDDAAYGRLIAQLNQFGLELGNRHTKTHQLTTKNSVYSPLSASMALSMTYAGARGVTADELEAVMTGGSRADTYHTGINRLAREIASRMHEAQQGPAGQPRKIALNIADAVFVASDLRLLPEFLDQLALHYDAGVQRADFAHAVEAERQRINEWVASETQERVKDLLPQGILDEGTRLVLVNALYFYGNWLHSFAREGTRDAKFQTLADRSVIVPTMHAQLFVPYNRSDMFVAADLPYVGDHLSMLLVVPEAGQFEAVREQVSGAWFESTLDGTMPATVNVALPKFTLTSDSFKLSESLKAMGIVSAFSADADFSGITADEQLRVAEVVQKAFVAVDEDGTEAAASTAVIIAGSSAPLEVFDLSVDRPFLFFIHDDSGAVLFSGHVVDPSQTD